MDSLAAILQGDATGWDRDVVLARISERFPAAIDIAPAPRGQAEWALPGGKAQRERREFAVATSSSKVLRDLAAIMSGQRDAFGQSTAESSEIFVATHADRVLATLGALAAARPSRENATPRGTGRTPTATAQATAAAPKATVRTPAVVPPAWQRPTAVDIEVSGPLAEQSVAAPRSTLAPDPILVDGSKAAALYAPATSPAALPVMSTPQSRLSPFGSRVVALQETSLDRVRGGFVTEGLNISFGIERAAYINGALVTSTSLNVSELGKISAGNGTPVLDAGRLALLQSGAVNVVSAGSISPTTVGNVIQNTLDGQNIQNVTVINATVNSLGVLRGLNLQSSLRGAVIDSLRR